MNADPTFTIRVFDNPHRWRRYRAQVYIDYGPHIRVEGGRVPPSYYSRDYDKAYAKAKRYVYRQGRIQRRARERLLTPSQEEAS